MPEKEKERAGGFRFPVARAGIIIHHHHYHRDHYHPHHHHHPYPQQQPDTIRRFQKKYFDVTMKKAAFGRDPDWYKEKRPQKPHSHSKREGLIRTRMKLGVTTHRQTINRK
jgi:hypothetical protein